MLKMAGPSLQPVPELTTVYSTAQTAPMPQGDSQPWQLVSPPQPSALVTTSKAVSRDMTSCHKGCQALGLGHTPVGSSLLVRPGPFEAAALPHQSGLCPFAGQSSLSVWLSHPLGPVEEYLHLPLFSAICPVCTVTSVIPTVCAKWSAQGQTEGRTNTYFLNRKQKRHCPDQA